MTVSLPAGMRGTDLCQPELWPEAEPVVFVVSPNRRFRRNDEVSGLCVFGAAEQPGFAYRIEVLLSGGRWQQRPPGKCDGSGVEWAVNEVEESTKAGHQCSRVFAAHIALDQ